MRSFTNSKAWTSRLKNATMATLFLFAYSVSMVVPFMYAQTANAVQVCINDQQGANDEPGQKDLTRMCKDNASLPTSQSLTWNWDDTGWPGGNTGDACALYDTDNDGFANYSVCVTVKNDPATQASSSPRIYSCDDNSVDKCFSATLQPLNGTTCSVAITATQPFGVGTNTPSDATATCTVTSASVGGSTASLIDVCSYPSQQPNSDPSDCIISIGGGKIEVKKSLSPTNDSGTFNLSVAGTVYATGGDGTTTGERAVPKGVVEFRETAATGNSLSNYTISVSCKAANGTGSVLPVTTISTGRFSVDIPEDFDVVCVITNTRQTGTVTLVKSVINDNGGDLGANDFGLTIGGSAVTSGQSVTLPSDVPVAINEAGATGYSFTGISGAGCPATLGGVVKPVNGQNITCTITNDDLPATLIVKKVIRNDNGGNKTYQNFSYKVNGGTAVPFDVSGTNSQSVSAGTYSIAEVADSGYAATYTNSLNANADCSSLVIPNGGTATCTITNDDKPGTLVVDKVVTNNNGSESEAGAFSFQVNGGAATSFTQQTDPMRGHNSMTVDAGKYTITEPAVTGYTASYNNCTDVTVVNGGTATCTITNDDNSPYLKLEKSVTNDNGGTATNDAWTLIATGSNQSTSFRGTTGVDSTGVTNFLAGSYALSETGGPTGYTPGSWSCTGGTAIDNVIQLVLGQSATCTINNNDTAPKLTLKKVVVNNNGGENVASDWTLTATGPTTFTGKGEVSSDSTFKAGTYTLSESGPSGYKPSSWVCDGGSQEGNSVSIKLGEDVKCTITNYDQAGKLIVKKVLKDDYSNATESDFAYTVNGGTAIKFEADGVNESAANAGTYDIVETEAPGYDVTYNNCSDVVVSLGKTETCTITNTAIQPKLIVKKLVDQNSTDLKAEPSDFTMHVEATNPTSSTFPGDSEGTTIGLDVGNFAVTETSEGYDITTDPEDKTADYLATFEGCTGSIKLDVEKTCTITNTAILKPAIKVVKTASADIAHVGDNVLYTFAVTNEGNTPLGLVEVTDTIIPDANIEYVTGDDGDNLLEIGEKWIFNAEYTVPSGVNEVNNIATAEGTDRNETTVKDTDAHELTVIHPAFAVTKTGPAQARPGDMVTYMFTIKNTGDTSLDVTEVMDNIAGEAVYVSGDVNEDRYLNPGETWVANAKYVIPVNATSGSAIHNVVKVCAEDVLEKEFCENADHTTKVFVPKVLGEVAPPPSTPQLLNTGLSLWSVMVMAFSAIGLALLVTRKGERR